ncbi:MAG: proton-conducting transporter membrane subunit [Actinomycetes bacterium]
MNQFAVLAPVLAPLLIALFAGGIGWHSWSWQMLTAAGLIQFAAGVLLAVATTDGSAVTLGSLDFRVDALSAFVMLVIGAVGTLAGWGSRSYLADEVAGGAGSSRRRRQYVTLVPMFLATMALAVVADNLGVMWAAIEGTTIVTAFLVGHTRTRGALEATWKYVVLGSTGIALAFLGTVLVHFAAVQRGVSTLSWMALSPIAGQLDPGVMRLAAALIVIGFGTKAGLAPMHAWLPDAHSQAPAPVSALMSGVLTSVAFYAILRYLPIFTGGSNASPTRPMLAVLGLTSLFVAASLLIAQRDLKRLLGYSTVENMGLMALGAAAGSKFAITVVLLHMVGHGMTKAGLFLAAGRVAHLEGTTTLASINGLLVRRPQLGAGLATGMVFLLGLPPSALLLSEVGIVAGLVMTGLTWVAIVAVVLLFVVFVAIVRASASLVLGPALDAAQGPTASTTGLLPTWTGIACTVGLVLGLPWLLPLLTRAAEVVTRHG